MLKQEIITRLKSAVVQELHLEGITAEDIQDKHALFGDAGIGLDSLDAVELVVCIEKNFGVVIQDAIEAQSAFASIDALADFIMARRRAC